MSTRPALPRWRRRPRLRLPITLSVLLITVNVVLMVLWIVLLAQANNWTILTLGTVLFVMVLAGLGVYLWVTLQEIQLTQRQANFVDSVTHELKSPLASIRLGVETLQLRPLSDEQRQGFYQRALQDLERLDELITQLLEVGRLDALVPAELEDVPLEPVLRGGAASACLHHGLPAGTVQFDLEPVAVRGTRLVLDLIFNNLLDNALKYGGGEADGGGPAVLVEARAARRGRVVVRIADRGPGVPPELRGKVFRLFFRGGQELQRTAKGTGVGLYVVRTLVHKLRGRVAVFDRPRGPGAVFEVLLPGGTLPAAATPEPPASSA